MTNIEVILLIIAIAFVVLVVFLTKAIFSLTKTLELIQTKINSLGDEPEKLMKNVNEISTDVNQKMKCLNPLFYSISNVGSCLESKTAECKEKMVWGRFQKERTVKLERDSLENLIELTIEVVRLFNAWKK